MASLGNLLVTGAARFVNVIKGTVQKAQNGVFYGTCATAAATKDKVVTLVDGDNFDLVPGVTIGVKFTYTNSYSSSTTNPITLNVNGTGAKNIWYNNTHSGAGNTGTNTGIYGYANRYTWYMYDGTYWCWIHFGAISNSNTVPLAQCETAAATAAKAASLTNHTLTANTYCHFNIRYANTVAGAITMNVDRSGAKPIYINGAASSSSNYTLPAGTYIAFYDGTNWYFNTDGVLPGKIENVSYVLRPDDFTGTDTVKVQACLDALSSTGGTIIIDRTYTLTANIQVSNNTNSTYQFINFMGIGKDAKLNMGNYSFIHASTTHANGGLNFSNIKFVGNPSGTSAFFVGSEYMIRMFFNNCEFNSNAYVFDATTVGGTANYLQSVKFVGCYFRLIKKYVINTVDAYDTTFQSCIAEPGDNSTGFLNVTGVARSLNILNCCIEGHPSIPIIINGCRGLHIENNYFEANTGGDIKFGKTGPLQGISINNNYSGSDNLVVLPKAPSVEFKGTIVSNNTMENLSGQYILKFDSSDTSSVAIASFINILLLNNVGLVDTTSNAFQDTSALALLNGSRVDSDFNSYLQSGSYTCNGTSKTNSPVTNPYGLLVVHRGNDLYVQQVFYDFTNNQVNAAPWFRRTTNGTSWTTWTQNSK